MGARKNAMVRNAKKLIEFGYNATYRDMMKSYRFWKKLERNVRPRYGRCGYYKKQFAKIKYGIDRSHDGITQFENWRIDTAGNPTKMPVLEPGMLTYEDAPLPTRAHWHGIRNTEIVVSDESRKRILSRLKEINECVSNLGINADKLGKKMREFSMAGKPGNTTDGKPS